MRLTAFTNSSTGQTGQTGKRLIWSVCDSQSHAANGFLEEIVSERTAFIHMNILEKQAKQTRKRYA